MSEHPQGLLGALAADALAMPAHWYYDRDALRRDYGVLSSYYFSKVVSSDKLAAMPAKKHVVSLTPEERLNLERTARSHKRSGLERQRARILLRSADGEQDAAIAQAVGVCLNTVAGVRRRFCQGARAKSVRRAEQTCRKARKLDGRAEAHLIALVCAGPPKGRRTWTTSLLAGRLVEARVVDSVTGETVRQTLKKMSLNLG